VRDTSILTAFSAKARTNSGLPILDCQSEAAKPDLQFLAATPGLQLRAAKRRRSHSGLHLI
jgi:hypothetical protein